MGKGKLITLEGIEGCGKSTQAERLYEHLCGKGLGVILSREPGGTELGEKIRDILLDSPENTISQDAELFLFNAARAQIIEEVVSPALQTGHTVVLDRYVHSTLAYQGYGHGARLTDEALIERVGRVRRICYEAASGTWPDIVFLIDVPVEVGIGRISGREQDSIERRRFEFHRRVRDGFLSLARAEPDIFEVIDGTRNPDEISSEIASITDKLLQDR